MDCSAAVVMSTACDILLRCTPPLLEETWQDSVMAVTPCLAMYRDRIARLAPDQLMQHAPAILAQAGDTSTGGCAPTLPCSNMYVAALGSAGAHPKFSTIVRGDRANATAAAKANPAVPASKRQRLAPRRVTAAANTTTASAGSASAGEGNSTTSAVAYPAAALCSPFTASPAVRVSTPADAWASSDRPAGPADYLARVGLGHNTLLAHAAVPTGAYRASGQRGSRLGMARPRARPSTLSRQVAA
jgi:hypothetical protein